MTDHLELPMREARDRFGELVDRALRDEPTVLTRHGRSVAAIVPVELLETYDRWDEERIAKLIDERKDSRTVSFDEIYTETLARRE